MTRINLNVPPAKLCDQHLLAEHRELKRIPNTINSGKAKAENIPDKFTLGSGHVKYFYDKLLYLSIRYDNLHKECLKRGFNVENYSGAFNEIPITALNDVEPSTPPELIERISERLNGMKNIRYYGKQITAQEAIKILTT